MSMRKNAGRGLALLQNLFMKSQWPMPNAVGAIGHIDVYPNSKYNPWESSVHG